MPSNSSDLRQGVINTGKHSFKFLLLKVALHFAVGLLSGKKKHVLKSIVFFLSDVLNSLPERFRSRTEI